MSEITIYSFDKCPFAQRTRMVLIEKDLPFELVEIDVYNKPDWFSSISPYGKVPVLSHEGNTIFRSVMPGFTDFSLWNAAHLGQLFAISRINGGSWWNNLSYKFRTAHLYNHEAIGQPSAEAKKAAAAAAANLN